MRRVNLLSTSPFKHISYNCMVSNIILAYPHIQPICLSIKSIEHQLTPGDDLVLAGWGLKENGN